MQYLDNISITNKILFIPLILFVLFIFYLSFSHTVFSSNDRELDHIEKNLLKMVEEIIYLKNNFYLLRNSLHTLVISADKNTVNVIDKHSSDFLKNVRNLYFWSSDKKTLSAIENLFHDYMTLANKITDSLVLNGNLGKSYSDIVAMNKTLKQLQVKIDEYYIKTKKQISKEFLHFHNQNNLVFQFGIISGVIMLILILLLMYIAYTSIILRIRKCVNKVNSVMSSGKVNLTEDILLEGSDEISCLTDSFNNLLISLRAVIQELLHSLSLMKSICDNLYDLSDSLDKKIVKQQLNSHKIYTKIDDVYNFINIVSENTKEALSLSEFVNKKNNDNYDLMQNTMCFVNNFSKSVNDSDKLLQELKNISYDVSKILDFLLDISEQVQILSINASIEVAHSANNNNNMSFGIIADELRVLSERSGNYTEMIETSINKLLKIVESTFTMMHSERNNINHVDNYLNDFHNNFKNVVKKIENICHVNAALTKLALKQGDYIKVIHKSIVQINHDNSEIDINNKNLANQSNSLHSLSNTLMGITDNFVI